MKTCETLGNYADKIDAVSSYNYKLNDEDRAQFTLRLNEHIRANTLNSAVVDSSRQLIAKLEAGQTIDTDDRKVYLELLQEQYEQIERSIVPLDFSQEIVAVTSEQDRYAQILTELEGSINDVLVKADAVEFNNAALSNRIERFKELNAMYLSGIPQHRQALADWDQNADISVWWAPVHS